MLALHGDLDINDPAIFQAYYRRLYDLNDPASQNAELSEAIRARDFVEVARGYRLIDQDAIQVLVPWADRWDDFQALRGAVSLFKANEDTKKIATTEVRHGFYTRLIREASGSIQRLETLADLLEDTERLAKVRTTLAEQNAKPSDWIVWRIEGYDPREDSEVQAWWRAWRRAGEVSGPTTDQLELCGTPPDDDSMICLLTGKPVKPLATHPKITGLTGVGGLPMGDVMVGFDKAAFGSYGLDQSANAAMGEEAAQKYVDGLNDLIRNHTRKIANTLVAHWYKDTIPLEDDPLAFLMGMETKEQTEAAAHAAVRRPSAMPRRMPFLLNMRPT